MIPNVFRCLTLPEERVSPCLWPKQLLSSGMINVWILNLFIYLRLFFRQHCMIVHSFKDITLLVHLHSFAQFGVNLRFEGAILFYRHLLYPLLPHYLFHPFIVQMKELIIIFTVFSICYRWGIHILVAWFLLDHDLREFVYFRPEIIIRTLLNAFIPHLLMFILNHLAIIYQIRFNCSCFTFCSSLRSCKLSRGFSYLRLEGQILRLFTIFLFLRQFTLSQFLLLLFHAF